MWDEAGEALLASVLAVLSGYLSGGVKDAQDAHTGIFSCIHDDEREVRHHQFTLLL